MEIRDLFELVRQVGPYAALFAFFVWRDYRREEKQSDRIVALNDFIQNKLLEALERNTQALNKR